MDLIRNCLHNAERNRIIQTMWSLLFLVATSLAHRPDDERPFQYDEKEFANCGKSRPTHFRMKKAFDNNSFTTDNVKKVIGGEPVEVGEMPWISRIIVSSKTYPKKCRLCTGALISGKYVLTAAHCFETFKDNVTCEQDPFDTMEIVVNVGATNLKPGSTKEQRGEERKAVKIFMDQKWYDNKCKVNDMAIIELDRKVSPEEYPPICLLHRDKAATTMGNLKEIKQHAWISGFGQNPATNFVLLEKTMIAPVTTCQFRGIPVVCSSMAKGKGGGKGDSGGPLAVLLNNRYYAYGVLTKVTLASEPKSTSLTVYEALASRMTDIKGIIYQKEIS